MGNIKWFIPRKYFAITKPLSNREFKKLRQWIENHEHVDFSQIQKGESGLLTEPK
jgi:hypothetical protein